MIVTKENIKTLERLESSGFSLNYAADNILKIKRSTLRSHLAKYYTRKTKHTYTLKKEWFGSYVPFAKVKYGINQIMELRDLGYSLRKIAKEIYGVHVHALSHWLLKYFDLTVQVRYLENEIIPPVGE